VPPNDEPRDRTRATELYSYMLTTFFQAAQQRAANTHNSVVVSTLATRRMMRRQQLADLSLTTELDKQSVETLLAEQMAVVEDR